MFSNTEVYAKLKAFKAALPRGEDGKLWYYFGHYEICRMATLSADEWTRQSLSVSGIPYEDMRYVIIPSRREGRGSRV